MLLSSSKIYSIGSSMVMIWSVLVWFISSIMAARVVDFPWLEGPVTRTNPWLAPANSCRMKGRFSSSIVLIFVGISRRATEISPRWKKTFTLKRALSLKLYEKSTSFSLNNLSDCSSVISARDNSRMSSEDSFFFFKRGVNRPVILNIG